jgi:hypothetical protein
MSPNAKKWLYIALGVFVTLIFLGIGAIYATVTYVQNHFEVAQHSSEEDVARAFGDVHKRFGDRPAFMEWKDDRPVVNEAVMKASGTPTTLTTLHVVAYNDDDGNLMKMDIPFWLLRLKKGPINLGARTGDWSDRVKITVEDLERYGPGIILEASPRDRGRALLWAE